MALLDVPAGADETRTTPFPLPSPQTVHWGKRILLNRCFTLRGRPNGRTQVCSRSTEDTNLGTPSPPPATFNKVLGSTPGLCARGKNNN